MQAWLRPVPRGFLDHHAPPVIFDEVQYAPDLLIYIKENVDRHRNERGRYLLTGSQNLLLMDRITESMAGRAAMLRLLPLSQREASGRPSAPLPWESKKRQEKDDALRASKVWESLLRGYYPEVVANPDRDIGLWHSSYIQTYLERDIRGLRQIGDLTTFQLFIRSLAARSGQLLNLTDLARGIGVAANTAKAWLSILEATFQVVVLRPYFANIGKRLVKTPKVYFTDSGTLCYLVGLRDPVHAASGPMGGAIFESAVLAEVLKTMLHRGEDPQLYFWRTATGIEVDLLVEQGGKLIPIEVKISATPRPEMAHGIRAFRKEFPRRAGPGYVISPISTPLPLGSDVIAWPFGAL